MSPQSENRFGDEDMHENKCQKRTRFRLFILL